jgi:hypothetical protein
MPISVRHLTLDDKMCQQVRLDVLDSIIPADTIRQVLNDEQAWEEREKKLNMQLMVYLIIALALFPAQSTTHVLRIISAGLRHLWPQPVEPLATKSALSTRRKQLGASPMQTLFRRVVHPIATPQTTGAFRFGRLLVAVDSTVDNVPDTAANCAAFGYSRKTEPHSPYPQVRCVYLSECGTHVIFAASFLPCQTSELEGAPRLLEQYLRRDMLLLWDRGFLDSALIRLVRAKGAHVVGRLAAGHLTRYVRQLCDGSYLAVIYEDPKHQRGKPLLVRVIEYTITDPRFPEAGTTQRLVTTLLNPRLYPALELIDTYHERWEIESAIDEYKTHQRLSARTLRSQTPEGVRQELWGVLLVHYAIRVLMHQSAAEAELDPDRLSFTHAVCVLHEATWRFAITPVCEHPALLSELLQDLRSALLPPRRLRLNARVVKRTRSKYERKKPQHYLAPHITQPFLDIVALI